MFSAALVLTPVLALGGAVTSTSAGASTPTRLLTCAGKLTAKPSTYVLSCADAGAGWAGITWTVWGAASATGHGFLRQNNCTPNCASGTFIDHRATVTLSDVVSSTKYGRIFSKAIFHYTEGGKAKTETFGLAD